MKKAILITAVITALVMFIVMCGLIQTNYQGHDAQYWYELQAKTETMRSADFQAITCIRGLGYTNLPGLEYKYTFRYPGLLDSAGNYYSKGQVDTCLYGL